MNQKRNTLRKVASVSSIIALAPSSWIKPVVSSIVLPAHAQTSFSVDLCMGKLTIREIDGIAKTIFFSSDTRLVFVVSKAFSTGSHTLGFSVPPGFSVSSNEHTYIDPNPDGPEESSVTFLVEVFEGATLSCSATLDVFWENS